MSGMQEQESNNPADVIVVGGGIIGCFTAHFLSRRGCRVTIVERDKIGSGASSGNCGYICPSHVMPLCGPGAIRHALPGLLKRSGALSIPVRFDPLLWKWLLLFSRNCSLSRSDVAAVARHQLLQWSNELYQELFAEFQPSCRLQKRGLLTVHRTAKTFEAYRVLADRLDTEFGIKVRSLEGPDLQKLEPCLVDGLAGGWHFPDDSHLHPGELMRFLHRQLLDQGVRILESTEVQGLEVERNRVGRLQTSSGPLVADQYVITAGAESPRLAKALKIAIPIVPGKGYSMDFQLGDPSQTSPANPIPTVPMIFEDSHVATTPLGDQLRIGSTMQLTGYDRRIDPRRVQMIHREAQTYLRCDLPEKPMTSWAGWRPMMADDLPCIGPTAAAANAWVASGNGMIGLSTATGTGQLVAQLMCGESPTIDAAAFSLRRFEKSAGTSKSQSPSTPTHV